MQSYSSSGEPPNLLPLSSAPEWALCVSRDFPGSALLVLVGWDSVSGVFICCLMVPVTPAIGPCCSQGLPSAASRILWMSSPCLQAFISDPWAR